MLISHLISAENVIDCTGPLLIGSEAGMVEKPEVNLSAWKEVPPHRDEDQVQLDVNRAFVYYPNGVFNPVWITSTAVLCAYLAGR